MIIGFYTQKGGTGKTAGATTLADGLADAGLNEDTLLLDADPQGNAVFAVGEADSADLHRYLCKDASLDSVCRQVKGREHLYLLAGNQMTSRIKKGMESNAEDRLVASGQSYNDDAAVRSLMNEMVREKLEATRQYFTHTVIDFPPSQDWWTGALLQCLDVLIVPTSMDTMELMGVKTAIETAQRYGAARHIRIHPTKYFDKRRLDRRNLALLQENYPGQVVDYVVESAAMRDARDAQQTIWYYRRGPRTESHKEMINGYAKLVNCLNELR
jgi:cellulose biosynthesis protein BcsQ